ncbi:hypothetical protein FRZ06_18065 [Anoxybacterium hadale]|uniref:Uncharacterized protein n=1 Tax=Anoxybacterium hadale TaxID=3408580 RepID=A0ACD1AFV7_9FIRM|nr:hypothetical protein FRZ06_18065 [Clostridiales bacterium]
MDEYLRLLMLAYFKEKKEKYSLYELRKNLGIAESYTLELINQLLEDGLLEIKNNLLSLSHKGRIFLMNNSLDWFSFEIEPMEQLFFHERWPLDKPYAPKNFSKKIK